MGGSVEGKREKRESDKGKNEVEGCKVETEDGQLKET